MPASTLPPLASAEAAPLSGPALFRGFSGSRLSWMVGLSVLGMLFAAWVAVALMLNLKARDAIDAEVRQNINLARVLQEQTVRVLATVDQASLRLRDAVVAGNVSPADLISIANETGLVPQILTQLSLIGPDGRFQGSNIDPTGEKTGHVDLSSREHVQVHLRPESVPAAAQQMSENGLFIGKPVLGKVSGKWTIQLSRKITRPDGQLIGVVVASVNPAYFEQVYQGVNLGTQGGVTLLGDDRSVRARVIGGQPMGMGSEIPLNPKATSGNGNTAIQGSSISVSQLDKIERVSAYHRVGSYPLRVFVLTSTDGALADWRSLRNLSIVLTGLFTLACLTGAGIFLAGVRRLEAQNRALAISEAQAQSASRAKSEFMAAISHELRTPLTSIRGFAELMEMRLEQPRFKEQAGLIRKAAEHLNALLSEILDLAKVEAGAMPITPEPIDLPDVLKSTLDLFGVTAVQKGLELRLEMDPQAPTELVCDSLRLKQVLNNLLSNALKFTKEGSITVAVDATPERVRFHVIDTGPGIPAHLHETIFERFRQGNDRVSYEHGGTGLGLALSRALAGLMGGTLEVQSVEGEGARFTLSLPRETA